MLVTTHGRVALLVLSAALAVPASAQETGFHYPSSWLEYRKMEPMPAMHMMDTDKKGYVTKEEFMKFQEEFFSRMDKDHDGKVTADEWLGHKPGKMGAKKMGADKMEDGEKK